METLKAWIQLIGGVIIVFGAALGILDWSIDPRLAEYARWAAYAIMLFFGYQSVKIGARKL